jgi:hypothetical protein
MMDGLWEGRRIREKGGGNQESGIRNQEQTSDAIL